MGYHQRGQVCLNGHKITGDYDGSPEFRQDFCDKCGSKTIISCPNCDEDIRGYFKHGTTGSIAVIAIPAFHVPNFCHACGSPFPWTQSAIEAAQELADEIDELNDDEKNKLKDSIPELAKDSPRTELAAVRFRKLIKKAGPTVGNAINQIVVAIATEAAKKSIGL